MTLSRSEVLSWLTERDPKRLGELWQLADQARADVVGDEVFLRGIIEFSNCCANDCRYCGIRASNRSVKRYLIPNEEIVQTAEALAACGITTVVLQSGQMPGDANDRKLGELICTIKRRTDLAVTLSVGNRPIDVYSYWRDCGMDRYLLRFETSDPVLFSAVHPNCSLGERLDCLHALKSLGVQTGSGFLIGLPGESIEILADNIFLCAKMRFDMIGIGPFIPHPHTPLGNSFNAYNDQPEMFFKALALLRLCNLDAHIPATTAFDAVFPHTGRDLALKRGANVFMPNSTPRSYRADYQLYPGKPCLAEDDDACANCAAKRVLAAGRVVGKGRGHSLRKTSTETAPVRS